MAFHNIDGVKSVQRSRQVREENESSEVGEIFSQQVSQNFGRNLDFDSIQNSRKEAGADRPRYHVPEEVPRDQQQDTEENQVTDSLVVRKSQNKQEKEPRKPVNARDQVREKINDGELRVTFPEKPE